MATSGLASFNMDFAEVAEEAWERAGREMRSGYDITTARRSMNLLTIEWQNRGINMWTITEGSQNLTKGMTSVALSSETAGRDMVDVIEQTIVVNDGSGVQDQNELTINRMSVSDYANITNKAAKGRPNKMYLERGTDTNVAYFWPVPDRDYTLKFWYLRRIQDAGEGNFTPDMPYRFLPCLVAGLAYYIAMKTPELSGRGMMLKEIYDEQFEMAASEDRTKVPARFVPRIGYI